MIVDYVMGPDLQMSIASFIDKVNDCKVQEYKKLIAFCAYVHI